MLDLYRDSSVWQKLGRSRASACRRQSLWTPKQRWGSTQRTARVEDNITKYKASTDEKCQHDRIKLLTKLADLVSMLSANDHAICSELFVWGTSQQLL